MKKYILHLGFFFVFVFASHAQIQKTSFTKNQLATGMSLFVENVKPAYVKGQTYKQFEKALLGTWKNTTEGTVLLNKAYQYLSKGVSKNQIVNEYAGEELTQALTMTSKLKKGVYDEKELFGGTAETNSFSEKSNSSNCKWYNLNCYMIAASSVSKTEKKL